MCEETQASQRDVTWVTYADVFGDEVEVLAPLADARLEQRNLNDQSNERTVKQRTAEGTQKSYKRDG